MPDPGSTRTIHLGQFRMTRLQLVNWGTFCGYKDFPIDERGVLFTGPSGSGKSSLMDGHSALLLPTHDQRFNASADLTARGARQGTRSVADYVRGAWSETNDEHEQSQVQYLRGGKPTWSAIAATYDNGLGAVTTAVVVRWFTGVETDGGSLKAMHQLHDGHFHLRSLQAWAEKGFDTRWLKAAHPALYPDGPTAYMRELARRIGLGTSRTALSLLGKAKAMKNVGDLNLFIRDNMLDEPETFAAAQKMLAAFTPLNEAFETAHRAHRQELILREVPSSWATYRTSSETCTLAESLLGMPMEHYLRGIHVRVLQEEMDRVDDAIARLERDLEAQEKRESQALEVYESLEDQWRQEGQALQRLELQLQATESQAVARESAHQIYSAHVTRIGWPCPQDEDAFTVLRGQMPRILEEARSGKAEIGPQRSEAFGAAAEATRRHEAKAAELFAFQSARSLIPWKAAERRDQIAHAANVPVANLPYAAELIDIADGQERWRPAAEKVMRNFGMRLLVTEHHKQAISEYIDNNDMRGLVEYSIITAASAHHPHLRPDTLAGKLIVDTDHPCGLWLVTQLARRFDHVCVETARDLEQHRIAVTVHGTVKLPGSHYRKDDRPELTSPSSYILGANTTAKRAAREIEATQLTEAKKKAVAGAEDLDGRYQKLDAILDAACHIVTYADWTLLDHRASERASADFKKRIADIKANNVDLQQLQERRDTAKEKWKSAAADSAGIRSQIIGYRGRRNALAGTKEQERRKPHAISDDAQRSYLDAAYSSIGVDASPETMQAISAAFGKELEQRKSAAEGDRRLAHQKIKTAMGRFLENWPDAAPDTSGDVDRCGADFAALYDEIAKRRLPDAMTRFQQIISEDMVPSVGVLQRAIENAASKIQGRVTMVNKGLRRVEFNPGTHLQIAYKASFSEDVKDFRGQVDTLLSNAPAARRNTQASLAQFQRVRDLMARFTSEDLTDRRWRANVLDVRNSYTFYGREENVDGITVHTYRNTASNSGGEQEKLVAFCLSAALSYNLADADSDGRPRFAPLMLDEAFSKSDETFSAQALAAFDEFGFQLLIAAPIRLSGIVEPYIGQAILVEKRLTNDGAHSSAASATFGDLAARRVAESDGVLRASA